MKSNIVIIVAMANNNVIGLEGKMPWHIKDDLVHFKELTKSHPVIFGRVTYDNLPVKPLPYRTNIIVSSKHLEYDGAIVKNSLEDAIEFAKSLDKGDVFIAGGQKIYEQSLNLADRLELTLINKDFKGDTYFPKIDLSKWSLFKKEEKDGFSFNTYLRKDYIDSFGY